MIGATFPALYGLLGYPLGHTLSPCLHQAALAALGLPGTYVPLPAPGERLAGVMAGVRAWRLPGLNVTVPHKVAVMAHLDGVTELAARIGAVNTLYWEGDRLLGDNTDYAGFKASLVGLELAGATVLVLGAGGAARAAVLALVEAGVGTLHVAARRVPAARTLREQLVPAGLEGTVVTLDAMVELLPLLATTTLVVNATPVGLHGKASPLSSEAVGALPPQAHVLDLIYQPARTPLLALAQSRGLATSNGAEMLVCQAAAAFERWTGVVAPLDVMRAALAGALALPPDERTP